MNQLEYYQQASEAFERDLAQCRRAAAEREAELLRDLRAKETAIDQLCTRFAQSQESRAGLAKDLGSANHELQEAKEAIRHLRIIEMKARLLVTAALEDPEALNVLDAARDLHKILYPPRAERR